MRIIGRFSYLYRMKEMLIRSLKAAADVLMPRTCIVCGDKLLLDEEHLCLNCAADLPRTFFWQQPRNPMADRLNELIQKAEPEVFEPYSYASALFFYRSEDSYSNIPQQIKYHGNLQAGRYFGRMLGKTLASSHAFADIDMVIPVPLHRARRWKRGYNQAEIIASGVASVLEAPLRTDVVRRTRRTQTQTKLGTEEKSRNVAGAFGICKGFSADASVRHILLVDDVFTTGSTAGECFRALRTVFPPDVRISVATLGFVGEG